MTNPLTRLHSRIREWIDVNIHGAMGAKAYNALPDSVHRGHNEAMADTEPDA